MSQKDSLQRFIFENAPVRGEYIYLEETVQTILNQHPYPAEVRQILGEALCVVGLLSAIIKFSGRLSVQFRGKGKLKLLIAQSNNQFQLRGLAKWDNHLSHNELIDSLSQGLLVITLDSKGNKEPYQGMVAWRGQSLAESIENYFRESEQLTTKMWLDISDHSAAGLLLQIVPEKGNNRKPLSETETAENLHWERIIKQTSKLQPSDLLLSEPQLLLQKLYPNEDIRIFSPAPVSFHCTCSRKKGEDAILLLGQEEAENELKDKQTIVVTCDFCNKEYVFDRVDVSKIFRDKDTLPTDTHLH